jgi:hypothetical protein
VSTQDNGAKPLKVSTLLTDLVITGGREIRMVRCPTCLRFAQVKRHLIGTHHVALRTACEGSRQRLIYDVDPADWAASYQGAADLVAQRRAPYSAFATRPKAAPPIGDSLMRTAAITAAKRAA